METVGYTFIWQCFPMAPRLKIYHVFSRIYVFSQWLSRRMESGNHDEVAEANDPPKLHRVFASSLDPERSWFALNSGLCGSKPSRFCSLGYVRVFPDEYRQVEFDNLCDGSGYPASASWFSASGRRNEKVFVASAFGLVVGILRQKSLEDVPFVKSKYCQPLVAWINAFDPNCNQDVGEPNEVQCRVESSQGQVSAVSRENLTRESQTWESLPPTPPSTPSPPNFKVAPIRFPPKSGRKRTLAELRADEDLSPVSKKRKIRETAVGLMGEISELCNRKGESVSTVFQECCLLTGKVGRDARGVFSTVMETVVREKGVKVAFSKLIPEEVWQERLKLMRVPGWIYLLFKLKSRMSDSAWQDFTNLTKLGRTGVRICFVT